MEGVTRTVTMVVLSTCKEEATLILHEDPDDLTVKDTEHKNDEEKKRLTGGMRKR